MSNALAWSDLKILEPLGEGQAGSVSKAQVRHVAGGLPLGTLVAVKRYKSWALEQPGQMKRVFRELRVGRELRHENLVGVIGLIADGGGVPALVMRYYPGKTLQRVLEEQRGSGSPLPLEYAFSLLRGIYSGLAALHERGIRHRDIKPANVIVSDSRPVLGDFGVVESPYFAEQTTTGHFLGTIRYAAPEYLFGDPYDQAADVYSAGAIAYELLTGAEFVGDARHWHMSSCRSKGAAP